MLRSAQVIIAVFLGLIGAAPAPVLADNEASNVAHVVAGPYGRCYAKSVPRHIYDPGDQPRQQGVTRIYRVNDGEDTLVHAYDWFSQRLFVRCSPTDDIVVVRVGPWHRGHDPEPDHLALAFYRGGSLMRRYSTIEIAGNEPSTDYGISKFRNVSASVSHYTVFASGPEMVRVTTSEGPVFSDTWWISATTIDGRKLMFDLENGKIQ